VRFVDTNVLLYAVSTDPDDSAKAVVGQAILTDPDLGLSVQVLQEFYVEATRSTRSHPLTTDHAGRLVQSFLRFSVQQMSPALMLAAITTHQRHQISYWDAAILEAARVLGCDVVLSEDLSAGQDYAGVVVQNPFST